MKRTNIGLWTGMLLVASGVVSTAAAGVCVGGGSAHECRSAAAGVSPVTLPAQVAAPGPGGKVAPIGSSPFGQTYGRWAATWWQWALEVPAAKNPLADVDGTYCAERQVGDVWFLAGSLGTGSVVRHCTIPPHKALFFPMINNVFVAFLSDPPEQRTDAFIRAGAACTFPVTIDVSVDGVPIHKPTSYFTGTAGSLSPFFNVQLPVSNVFGFDEASVPELALTPSAEQGYYLFLSELAPGTHHVRWIASGCTANGMQDVTYHLQVQ